MTAGTGIGDIERDREIGPGHAKTVVAPGVDAHIGLSWHMAIHALGPN